MKMEHLIVEGYCDAKSKNDKFLCNGELKIGIYCFECPMFSYTFCPNELALSDDKGVVIKNIGFGGDMEPTNIQEREKCISEWSNICKRKIEESYDMYIK